MVARLLVLLVLLVGCGDNLDTGAQIYTCVVTYRCAGDENVTARFALPCAESLDEASDKATDAAIGGASDACNETPWQYVRVMCEPYEPTEACDLAH